ncbi:unnamed protein product [Brugia timori]|uniref:Ovule protein n=1 Tax=Brugia timori TaxID=42155 RepID=A0A0R3R4V5_9BILA|nr:unnamed protein product [Brugia timori]
MRRFFPHQCSISNVSTYSYVSLYMHMYACVSLHVSECVTIREWVVCILVARVHIWLCMYTCNI